MADTNVFLHDFHWLDSVLQHLDAILVVPPMVLFELDRKKRHRTLGYRARRATRYIENLLLLNLARIEPYGPSTQAQYMRPDMTIAYAYNRLVQRARYPSRVFFMTLDRNCRLLIQMICQHWTIIMRVW